MFVCMCNLCLCMFVLQSALHVQILWSNSETGVGIRERELLQTSAISAVLRLLVAATEPITCYGDAF